MPQRDAWLIYAAASLRSAAVGVVGVILAIFLGEAGFGVATIGLLISTGIAGITVMTAAATAVADRLGRRRSLVCLALLSALGYATLALTTRLALLLPLSFACMVNGMGRDRGPAGALEQAILPATTDAAGRTWTLAWYNLGLDVAHALGALAALAPTLLASRWGLASADAHRLTLVLCGGAVASSALCYASMTSRVEPAASAGSRRTRPPIDARTKMAIRKLALLFGIDSLGGGFLNSALIAYWFFQRYGISEGQLALVFFAARLLNALSHVVAAWLARRFGLLNTMVMTHAPSSLLLMSAPLAPSGAAAIALFLGREALVEMDVPTRQSYVMAIVEPDQRTYASGATNFTRTAAWAIGPTVAGFVMQHVVLAAPLFIGGTLKLLYDLLLYVSFRNVRPPEEAQPAASSPS